MIKINKIPKVKTNVNGVPLHLVNMLHNCNKCFLSSVRAKKSQPVIGRGTMPAKLLLINEAPGVSEEILNTPFVGRSGKLLDKIFSDARNMIYREYGVCVKIPTYFITNIVFCRPTEERLGHQRRPKRKEVLTCSKNLFSVINEVNPKIIIFVGKVSGEFYKKEFPEAVSIQHPDYLLRGGGVNHPAYLRTIRTMAGVIRNVEKAAQKNL